MTRKKGILLFVCIGLIVIAGIISSFFWLFRIYLPDQINTNENARRYQDWYNQDSFVPPVDRLINDAQINSFLNVNEDLAVLLKKLRRKLEENKWRMAIDILKMQPEWIAHKYLALRKYHLSPREYEWIEKEIVRFWIYRWQESSLVKLRQYGWEMQMFSNAMNDRKPENYELLIKQEKELNKIFDILWPDETVLQTIAADSA
jgi:hypothetical protein